jgi:hypothetical protein
MTSQEKETDDIPDCISDTEIDPEWMQDKTKSFLGREEEQLCTVLSKILAMQPERAMQFAMVPP